MKPAVSKFPSIHAVKPLRLGSRRVTRAHLTLAARPKLVAQVSETVTLICAALEKQLKAPVKGTARLLYSAVSPEQVLPSESVFIAIELAASGGVALLELERPFAVSMMERLVGETGKVGPVVGLTRIEEAALGFLCLLSLSAVKNHPVIQKHFAPRLSGIFTRRGEALQRMDVSQLYVPVEVALSIGPTAANARLLLPSRVLQAAIEEAPAEEETSAVAPSILAAELTFRPHVGTAQLTEEEVESLGLGDVILFDELKLGADGLSGRGRLSSVHFTVFGQFGREGFTAERTELRVPKQEQRMGQGYSEVTGGVLPVEVEIELARLRIPLSELAALKPGKLLPLKINVADPVLVRVGNRAIARAELVEIEGEVGARILSLLP